MGVFDELRLFSRRPKPIPPTAPPKINSALEAALRARSRTLKPEAYSEVDRICNLQIRREMTDIELEEFNRRNILHDAYTNGDRLFRVQAEALNSYRIHGGLFGPIGVGWGKTLITLAIAAYEYSTGARKGMLLVPTEVYSQLMESDLRWARTMIPFQVPVFGLKKPLTMRQRIAQSGRSGLYIVPYSLLSVKDTQELLSGISPEYILCDEAHKVKRRDAARTKRLMNYVTEHHPRGVALSGTITNKSVMEYHHLIRWCLGNQSPLPISPTLANEWAAVVDADSENTNARTGPVEPLLDWARNNFPEAAQKLIYGRPAFREAFQLRLLSAPGVIGTGDADIGVSLLILNSPVKDKEERPGWEDLKKHVRKIEEEWVTPAGDELEHAIHKFRWLFELSAGFYNELYWPDEAYLLRTHRAGDVKEAEDLLARAKIHHERKQEYVRQVRKWLQENYIPGLDTPLLVANDLHTHGARNVGHTLWGAWRDVKDAEFDGMPERLSRAIRVCDYKIRHAADWAERRLSDHTDKAGGIIWYHNREIGTWLREELKRRNIDSVYCPAGEEYNKRIVDPAHRRSIVIASISAHGTGKNLQHFHHNLFLQWPRPANAAEQTIGRTHRNRQEADEVLVFTNHSTEFDELNFAATINDACYIQTTTGTRQKLMFSVYMPMPKIFPSDALIERGFENKILTKDALRAFERKFGTFK